MTMTADDDNRRPYKLAIELAHRIFTDILPHDADLPPKNSPRRVAVPRHLQIEAVDEDTELAEGDVLVTRETRRDPWPRDRRRIQTAREYINGEEVRFYLVAAATAKTITVRPLSRPGRWWRDDLRDLAAHARDYTERIARVSKSREVGRLGALADITARVNAHPQAAAYAAAYAAAQAKREADDAEEAALRKRAEEAAEPARRAAARVNALLDSHAFSVAVRSAEGPGVYVDYDWRFLTAEGDAEHGVTYLHGLAHQGRLPEAELDEAVAALRLLASARD